MAARSKTTTHLSRPSSLYIDRIITAHRNQARLPTGIWPDKSDHHPPENQEEESTLKLSHPILRALESCSGGATKEFDQVHAQLIISDLFQIPLAAGRAIKKLCSSPSSIDGAIALFSRLEEPDAFICNTIMKSFVSFNDPKSAFGFYRHRMVPRFVPPNHYTFPLLSKLCAELGLVREGEKTHGNVVKSGFELDLFVQNSMIYMYSSFGNMGSARILFYSRLDSDLVTWNSMIDGYVKNGAVTVARKFFDEMPRRDNVSWNVMIAGLAGSGDMDAAKELFSKMPERDVVSWNSVLNGHAKIGEVALARDIFDLMPDRSVISWNIMLALYVRVKAYPECLTLFDRMMGEGRVSPNEATLVSILTACANLGELSRGKWVHSYIQESNGKIVPDVLLSTALLTMYAKCGATESAREVFDSMPEKSIISLNSMIMGYAIHGQGERAIEMFLEMERIGPRANESTFVSILCACTHGGLVLEGWWCFDRMMRVYGIKPTIEHYGCMVDLLGRAGLLTDSEELTKKMTMEPTPSLLGALLNACRTHSNSELGEIVAKRLMEIKPRDIGPYVLLSNIYAADGRWEDVEKVRSLMKKKGLLKAAGISWIGGTMWSESEPLAENNLELVPKKSIMYSMLTEIWVVR